MSQPTVHTITSYDEARDAYRQKDLRQALYDAGEVIMADVLVNLHGDDHRARRRLENRLFSRSVVDVYERELFPPVIAATIAPHVASGHAELVKLGHQMMMNLAAQTAGVDRPLGTPDETFRLYDYLMRFIEGATLAHYTGDRDAKRAEVADKLAAFAAEFVEPSIARRVAAGDGPAHDVLSVLLANNDNLDLPRDVIVREIAFYLLAGAHTSATAFTRVSHNIFKWLEAHPEDAERVTADRLFVQRCTHETIRLQPSSPTAMRWVLSDVHLKSGRTIPQGDKLVIDLLSVNRDTTVFGEDAADFNPHRTTPHGIAPWGLSYGSGMHACIGQDLASGVAFERDGDGSLDAHLFGLVPQAVQAIFDHGARPDPNDLPELDESTTRPYFGRYPIVFDSPPATVVV